MRRILFTLFLSVLAMPVEAQQVQLQLDRTNPANMTVGQLSYLGAVVIPPGPERLGGLSALSVSSDRRNITALSDSGRIFEGRLNWSSAGRLVGVELARGIKLLDEDGNPVVGRARSDSESLVARIGTGWLVGFERQHRIEQYATWQSVPMPFAQPPGLATLPTNEGLEGITQLQDGRFFTIAEASGSDGAHPAWIWQNSAWQSLKYQSSPGLKPVDLSVLPDGDILVLERGFNLFYGFRVRIARIDHHDIVAGAALAATTLAQLETPLLTENFEGMSVVPAQNGKSAAIFIVSDNNFNAAQQTILAAFELNLPESLPSGGPVSPDR